MQYLEIAEAALVHCNNVNNNYHQNSTVLYTFVPIKSFSQLLDISTKNVVFLKGYGILSFARKMGKKLVRI